MSMLTRIEPEKGMDRASQVQRVKRHEILAGGYEGGAMMASPGGSQRAGVLRVDLVLHWHHREVIIGSSRYQKYPEG